MDRNFNKPKGTPFRPIRSCLKKIPPLDSRTMLKAIIKPKGRKKRRTIPEKMMSNSLFMRNFTFDTKLIHFLNHGAGITGTSEASAE
jgi:hypothetical protein